ncbi:sortilin-like [Patiria miniata]|uniref:VPS10 domain-containing protein n=1 Tax=Patiria miniata TaxID=46514 RepID=A0A914B8U6_PATMI|nr:sortilin-like [Patiria miniata]
MVSCVPESPPELQPPPARHHGRGGVTTDQRTMPRTESRAPASPHGISLHPSASLESKRGSILGHHDGAASPPRPGSHSPVTTRPPYSDNSADESELTCTMQRLLVAETELRLVQRDMIRVLNLPAGTDPPPPERQSFKKRSGPTAEPVRASPTMPLDPAVYEDPLSDMLIRTTPVPPDTAKRRSLEEEIDTLLLKRAVRVVPQGGTRAGFMSTFFLDPMKEAGGTGPPIGGPPAEPSAVCVPLPPDGSGSSPSLAQAFGPYGLFGGLSSGTRKLLRSTDYGKTFLAIKMNVYSFGVQGKFVFAAVDGGKGDNGRILYVSKDDGKTWSPTQLPVVTSDRFFSVLDMNEGMLFMHVDDEGDTGSGTLYTSDADGIVFSVSLKKHLFAEGSATTDFYRVASMRGVYMASQVGDDLSIHTNITFDRGGIWHPVKAPKGSKCKNSATSCSLQIHNRYSQIKGVNAPSSPLSQSSAVGLILAHGNVADALETHPPDVFISNDGGYNWTKALSGPHHYTVTNHGGLLLAISAEQDVTNTIKFSYDEGHCWNEYKFCDEPFSITGLLPEPSTNSLNVSIWGFGSEDRRWRIVTIDFSAVLKDECTEKDFDEWVPHLSNERRGCLLGLNETFERVKPDSLCRLNYAHEPKAKQSNPCSCTKDDYECDFGFSRKGESKECKVSADVDPSHLDICINGNEEKINTWGYRKIPGDMCVNGFQPVRSMDTLQQQCTSGLESNLSVEQLDGHQVKTWTIVMILLAVAFFSGILVFLLYRHNKLPCTRPSLASYRYSQLSDGDNLDKMIDLESHPTYHDSSDEEILE